jgi:hypothetical protein
MVRRLVDRLLEGERTAVVVHHDPRGPELDLPYGDRVLTMPDPRPCLWGRMEFARAMVRGVDFARAAFPDLSWAVLTSGADYPCRSMRWVEDELARSEHDAMLRWFRADGDPADDVVAWQASSRRRYLKRRRLPGTHRSVPLPRRHPFGDRTRLFVGDVWVNLAASAVDHVLEQRRRRPDLERYFDTCSNPDEAFLPTLLLNDAEHLSVANDRRRYIRWVHGAAHPEMLSLTDIPQIAAGNDFFARKVDRTTTPEVLDALDELARR